MQQVVVEVSLEMVGEEPKLLAERIVLAANGWTLECISGRDGPGV